MITPNSITFTPAAACTLLVTGVADFSSERSTPGPAGWIRLSCTQLGVTETGEQMTFATRTDALYVRRASFSVVAGASVTVAIEATAPSPGSVTLRNLRLDVEQIKR